MEPSLTALFFEKSPFLHRSSPLNLAANVYRLYDESIAFLEEADVSCQERKCRSFLLLHYLNGTSLVVSHSEKPRVDTSGWVLIQPFQLKQAVLRTSFFVSGIEVSPYAPFQSFQLKLFSGPFSSSLEFTLSLSLFSYLRAFGLTWFSYSYLHEL